MTSTENRPAFIMVPAELIEIVVEDGLSKEAAWLYVVLLSHHNRGRRDDDVWPSRAVLAKKLGFKKIESVDRYTEELRKVGLITTEQRRRSGNMKTSNRYTLHLVTPRADEEVAARKASSADTPYSGHRYPRQRGTVTPQAGHELEELEPHELKDVEEMSRTSGRSAPDGARHGKTEDRKTGNDWHDPWDTAETRAKANNGPTSHERATYENWHDRDRQTFKEHVGDDLISDGSQWKKGRYTAEAFYKAFRLKQENRKRWPGQYVEMLSYAGDSGVDDWLIDQGLTRPEWQ